MAWQFAGWFSPTFADLHNYFAKEILILSLAREETEAKRG